MGDIGRVRVVDLLSTGALAVGDGYRAKNAELGSHGLPFCRAGNVHQGFDFAEADRFPESNLGRVGEKVSRPGDVVFTSKGTVGRFARVRPETERFVYSPQLCYWRSLDPSVVDPDYLYYWMSGPQFRGQFKAVAGQTDMAEYVSLGDQRAMWLDLPDIATQRPIGRILGALDDKIELNRRTSETLEATARALFKSWFVDGSTPGEGGWRLSAIGDEFRVTMGQSPPGSTYNSTGEGLPFYQGRADFGPRFPARRVYCTAPTRTAAAGDTLLSVRAPVGDINIATETCAIGRGVAAIRHRSGSRTYTFEFMGSMRGVLDEYNGDGTVFGAIGGKDLSAIPCLAPPDGLVRKFDEQARPLDERLENLKRQRQTLAEVRDAMLPRLLSGEMGPSFGGVQGG